MPCCACVGVCGCVQVVFFDSDPQAHAPFYYFLARLGLARVVTGALQLEVRPPPASQAGHCCAALWCDVVLLYCPIAGHAVYGLTRWLLLNCAYHCLPTNTCPPLPACRRGATCTSWACPRARARPQTGSGTRRRRPAQPLRS